MYDVHFIRAVRLLSVSYLACLHLHAICLLACISISGAWLHDALPICASWQYGMSLELCPCQLLLALTLSVFHCITLMAGCRRHCHGAPLVWHQIWSPLVLWWLCLPSVCQWWRPHPVYIPPNAPPILLPDPSLSGCTQRSASSVSLLFGLSPSACHLYFGLSFHFRCLAFSIQWMMMLKKPKMKLQVPWLTEFIFGIDYACKFVQFLCPWWMLDKNENN